MSDDRSSNFATEGVCAGSAGDDTSTSSGSGPVTDDKPSSQPEKAPFQASVEDCPEEDGVPIGTPRPTPASPIELTPATPTEPEMQDNNSQDQPPSSQEHSLPAFIQLSGPPPQDHTPQESTGPLRYLDPDSPVITQEAIRRSVSESTPVAQPVATSPSVLSHSSVPSSHYSEVFSPGGHRSSNSHDSSSWGSDLDDSTSHVAQRQYNYTNQYPSQGPPPGPNGFSQPPGWPGSPHTQYSHPNASPYPAYSMAEPYQGSSAHPPPPNHWQQKPPKSGYQQLAAKLTGDDFSIPKTIPIYRRFETLNHRLLLQLQDEIVELEQQLDQLDESDTHARMGIHGPTPASRRAEVAANSNICLEKRRLFQEIGYRLENYYKLLESYRNLLCFSKPQQHEINDYRAFLAREQLICQSETLFLHEENDLMSLEAVEYEESRYGNRAVPSRREDATPTPQSTSVYNSPEVRKAVAVDPRPQMRRPLPRQRPPTDFAYAVLGAVAAPLLGFSAISGFVERMVIVGIVFVFVSALVAQSSLLAPAANRPGFLECSAWAVIYLGFMGVVARSFA